MNLPSFELRFDEDLLKDAVDLLHVNS